MGKVLECVGGPLDGDGMVVITAEMIVGRVKIDVEKRVRANQNAVNRPGWYRVEAEILVWEGEGQQ